MAEIAILILAFAGWVLWDSAGANRQQLRLEREHLTRLQKRLAELEALYMLDHRDVREWRERELGVAGEPTELEGRLAGRLADVVQLRQEADSSDKT